jgi:Family of unknown function (DUF5988)
MSTGKPNAILRGGPAIRFADEQKVLHVLDPEATVKLSMGNCHEHFRPTGETVAQGEWELRVFEWQGSTYVAE